MCLHIKDKANVVCVLINPFSQVAHQCHDGFCEATWSINPLPELKAKGRTDALLKPLHQHLLVSAQ